MPTRTPLRILIVDDSREDRAEAKAALLRGSARRFDFLEAELGSQAIALCKRDPPPVCVLLDHHLPDMDSLEVIDRLRPEQTMLPSVPVVIVTGSEESELGSSAARAGAMGFIGKDWLTPDSLTRVVDNAIERHSLFEKKEALLSALQEREERLQLALKAGQAGTFHHDLRSDRVTWSVELEAIFGYEPGSFHGTFQDVLRHIHPDDAEQTRAVILGAITRCAEYNFEFRIVRVDGQIAWLAGRGRAYGQKETNADTITGVAFDITLRKGMEQDLRNREQQLSLALRAGGLGLWDWDVVHDRAIWSEQAWQLFEPGGLGGDVTFERWLSCIHPDDRHAASSALKRALEGAAYQDEFRVLRADGGACWLEAVAEVIRSPAGAAQRVIGVVRDVTQRKAMECELRESETRFRQMAQTVPQVVFTCRPDGSCEWVNDFWHTYTGNAEFSAFRWVQCLHPDDRESISEVWRQRVLTGEPYSMEYRIRRADGSYAWHLSRAVPVRSLGGDVFQWVGTSIDIDSMRNEAQLREQLIASERAARTQAEVANHLKDEFLATLSHELRTPLANVLAWARVAQKKFPEVDPQLRRALAIIVDNAMTQSKIIDDMLDMNRIMRGKLTLELGEFDLRAFAENCCASQRPTAEAKNLTLICDCEIAEGSMARADRSRLQQVLGNLLTNAVKFTPAGGRIEVDVRETQGWHEISVRDTGIGIPGEVLPYVFDRFRQGRVDTSSRQGGLGLGLAIVKQVVQLHGGEVTASSDGVGRGSVFSLRWPRIESVLRTEETELRRGRAHEDAAEIVGPDALRDIHVIVVEDEPSILEYTCGLLAEHGAIVQGFASGADALAAIPNVVHESRPSAVLITDLGMTGIDGFALIRAVRTNLGLGPACIPALAVTAFAREEDREYAASIGFQGYLTKPYEAAKLIAGVRQLGRGETMTGNALPESLPQTLVPQELGP